MPTPDSTFEPFRDSVYRWAMKVLARHEDALDVTQDVSLKWLTRTEPQSVDNTRAWLRRVTINRALDVLRSRKLRAPADSDIQLLEAPEPAASDKAAMAELQTAVRTALLELTDNQRQVLVAKVFDAETFAQIAAGMNLSIPTVKTHYLRALTALEPKLSAWD